MSFPRILGFGVWGAPAFQYEAWLVFSIAYVLATRHGTVTLCNDRVKYALVRVTNMT